ncbi:hypothetical protein F5Y10DRAFT_265654 [Nemania abortiva]|nr:hypothetical protein F5Y10DRAFT_265654 [Nemania abortiva]
MSSNQSKHDDFLLSEEGDRPYIKGSDTTPKFRVGDKVYLLSSNGTRDGPFLVESVVSAQEYTLCLESGTKVRGGDEFNMAQLEAA